MTPLKQAREDVIRWDRMTMRFPNNAAIHRARLQAWDAWWIAVHYWRLGGV